VRTFLDRLEELADSQPHEPAIVLAGTSISFQELWKNMGLVTTNAYRLGYRPGDTFIFASKPSPMSIPLAIGLVRAGLRVGFLDPFTATNSFHVRVGLLDPTLVLAESSLFATGSSRTSVVRRLLKITIADFGSVTGADFFFTGPRLPFLPGRARNAIREFYRPVDHCVPSERVEDSDSIIVFTSGTTADPKGVVHSLESISANFDHTAKIFDFTRGDRVLSEPITVGLVALSHGATWVIPGRHSSANFNKYFAVPTDALQLMDERERRNAPKNVIEYFGMGGAPIPPSLVKRVLEVVGEDTRIPCIYGMTEILPVAYCDGREKLVTGGGDLLGKPLTGVDIRLAEDGELEVQGSGLMKSYLGRAPEDWHPTGDLARLDDSGNLLMLGRKKNMLIRGDMNIYPSLYEPGITTISGVADAVMVGVPNEFGDDQIVLFVVPESGHTNDEALRRRMWAELPRHVDKAALPDRLMFLPTMPVAGRSKKRDMRTLVELARKHIAEARP
jgi:acyl-CoA synthetase (AMP-forming)/AMP-acid ligase II